MGSDRARISYDKNQQYRGVIAQQGRVNLEADWNEAQQITHEEMREQALDIVGPNGTSDNGYEIRESLLPPFKIGKGSMYVGGMRVFRAKSNLYGYQKNSTWLDWRINWRSDPNSWESGPISEPEFIYLYLREQEVSAVEDPALLEPALGGPDTTQRAYLIQHIIRHKLSGEILCSNALHSAEDIWKEHGLAFDSTTMRLDSQSLLRVVFSPPPSTTNPCDPMAEEGYLGAENQLIRIQISAPDKFLWGFDNAFNLYRVDEVVNANTIRLKQRPVDERHWPRANQVVEVLPAAARLSNGEYVATATGYVFTLTEDYDPDEQTLSGDLPDIIWDETSHPTNPLFVRVWQREETFERRELVALGETGLQIRLTTKDSAPFHIGDYWQIGVRPQHPTTVYPKRYLDRRQSPDGPRLWACPLAVIKRDGDNLIVEDCRKHFVSLTGPPAIHVIDANWANDDIFPLNLLGGDWGLKIYFDQDLDPDSVVQETAPMATMIVTLEVPEINLPFGAPDMGIINTDGWRTHWIGRAQSFILNGKIQYNSDPLEGENGSMISWELPNIGALGALLRTQTHLGSDLKCCARVRVTLKGSSIWGLDEENGQYRYLDGQTFGQRSHRNLDPGIYRTALKLPSGNNAKASDFESWFWIKLDNYSYPSVAIGDFLL